MTPALELLRRERRARWLFAAYAQSALGTGAAYVALLLLAYERFESPWAISLILLAELAPAVALGALLGAAADRRPRRACMVAADLLRAAAFGAIALGGSFELTLALVLVSGAGGALFKPAALAALPGLVAPERLAAATSLWGALTELGYMLGPALAAGVMLVASPELLLALNAASFLACAAVLARLPFGEPAGSGEPGGTGADSLLGATRKGIEALRGMRDVRALILVSAAVMGAVSVVNVAELLLARDAFGAGNAGFSLLVAASGVGIMCGALLASRPASPAGMKRRFTLAVLALGAAFALAAATPVFAVAVACFAAAGVANGLLVAYSRLLIQTSVPGHLLGRVFGFENALVSAAFGASFLGGGALVAALGPRPAILAAGAATVAMAGVTAHALRHAWRDDRQRAVSPAPAPAPA